MPRGTYRNRHRWPEEKKTEALALKQVYGAKEASARTGIPYKTILRWSEEGWAPDPQVVQTYLKERDGKILARIDTTLEMVLNEIDFVVSGGRGYDFQASRWLHAIVGVFSQYFQKRLLLQGLPTNRVELDRREEYGVTQRIITDEKARGFAWQLYLGKEGRPGSRTFGGLFMRSDEEPVDSGEASAFPE